MKYIKLIFLLCPVIVFSQQINYTITVNSSDAWHGNLFFHQGGQPPSWTAPPQYPKPVKIIDSTGTEMFSQAWGKKGWEFKVNYNNKLSYFDRQS